VNGIRHRVFSFGQSRFVKSRRPSSPAPPPRPVASARRRHSSRNRHNGAARRCSGRSRVPLLRIHSSFQSKKKKKKSTAAGNEAALEIQIKSVSSPAERKARSRRRALDVRRPGEHQHAAFFTGTRGPACFYLSSSSLVFPPPSRRSAGRRCPGGRGAPAWTERRRRAEETRPRRRRRLEGGKEGKIASISQVVGGGGLVWRRPFCRVLLHRG